MSFRGLPSRVPEVGDRVMVTAPAKINLGLEVLRKREDGYHELATIFQALQISDRVDIEIRAPHERSQNRATEALSEVEIELQVRPAAIELGPVERNLVVRAARSYLRSPGVSRVLEAGKVRMPGLAISLEKRIPVGAGLGGGSSDAAAVLVGLNRLFGELLLPEQLHDLAESLGADVPFFLKGGTCFGRGKGDRLETLPPWPRHPLVLIFPNVSLSTSSIFSSKNIALTPLGPLARMTGRQFARDFWRTSWLELRNDLQDAVIASSPVVGSILEELRVSGSVFARVTGSGSSVFAVAPSDSQAAEWVETFRDSGYWATTARPARRGCWIRRFRRGR